MKEYDNEEELVNILTAPYSADKLRWRIGRAGEKNGKIWAMLLAYVDARDVRHRLDEAFGRLNWGVTYSSLNNDTIIAEVSARVKISGEIVETSAQDGAGETQVEKEKGGISDAFKRASNAAFGVYEYLYDIKDSFANVHEQGRMRGQVKVNGQTKYFKYDPPVINISTPKKAEEKPTQKKLPSEAAIIKSIKAQATIEGLNEKYTKAQSIPQYKDNPAILKVYIDRSKELVPKD